MPNLIGERRHPTPPPPEATPGVSRDLFHLFFQVEIRHRRPRWRHPIAGAKWGRECDTIMAILSSLFRHDGVGPHMPRAPRLIPSPPHPLPAPPANPPPP